MWEGWAGLNPGGGGGGAAQAFLRMESGQRTPFIASENLGFKTRSSRILPKSDIK